MRNVATSESYQQGFPQLKRTFRGEGRGVLKSIQRVSIQGATKKRENILLIMP